RTLTKGLDGGLQPAEGEYPDAAAAAAAAAAETVGFGMGAAEEDDGQGGITKIRSERQRAEFMRWSKKLRGKYAVMIGRPRPQRLSLPPPACAHLATKGGV
ncbi:hypothetical protein Vafri_320, partial [Volvox africanus]